MKNEFIETANVNHFRKICQELEDPRSLIGPSLAMVTGDTGRGKTETAKQYTLNSNAIYIPPLANRTPAMVLRDIVFELQNIRPIRFNECLIVIGDEMAKERRIIIIDEADLLSLSILEMLRNINERYACPILLIGEDKLKGKVASRRRINDRIRRRMEFSPVTQQDIAFFLKKSLGLKVQADITAEIHSYSKGSWRRVETTAIGIERAMSASEIKECNVEMVKDVIRNS